jgi:hypothetical protein
MTPFAFPESNCTFGPPPDMTATQVIPIPAYRGKFEGGSCDGSECVVVAYKISPEEFKILVQTGTIYFSMMGGLAPHYPSLSFHDATHPA